LDPLVPASAEAPVIASPHDSLAVTNLVDAATRARGGRDVQAAFRALAARKTESLPLVKARLREGERMEKFMLTKFLRYCPWPESLAELTALARDRTQHWMPRQGALYALGALGDKAAGPDVTAILGEPDCPAGVRLVAIAALARMDYREAAPAIRPLARDGDIHMRLFATHALARFGEPVDSAFLLSALQDDDYVVRQEACGALQPVPGPDMTAALRRAAADDPHEAVRNAAAQALLERELRGKAPAEKTAILRGALAGAEVHMATWIVRTILEQGGNEGRTFVEDLAAGDDRLGERARTYLQRAGEGGS
jgi:HEAT repeat protein